MYKIDNRRKKSRGKYTFLGIIIGVLLTVGGFYVYENYKQPIIQKVNEIKETGTKINIINSNPIIQKVEDIPKTIISQGPTKGEISNQQSHAVNEIELEHQIHLQINSMREENGLKPLQFDEKLAMIAREHSKDMILNNYFDHTAPNGDTLQSRLSNAKYPCYPSGENIQENYISTDNVVNSIVNVWMESPGHKNNILQPIFDREGIGIYIISDDIMITEDFC